MDTAEFIARVALCQKMDSPKDFDINSFLNKEAYFEGFEEEKIAYFKRKTSEKSVAEKLKENGKT